MIDLPLLSSTLVIEEHIGTPPFLALSLSKPMRLAYLIPGPFIGVIGNHPAPTTCVSAPESEIHNALTYVTNISK